MELMPFTTDDDFVSVDDLKLFTCNPRILAQRWTASNLCRQIREPGRKSRLPDTRHL